jgi:hypothetical protein
VAWGAWDGWRERRAERTPVDLGGRLTGIGLAMFAVAAVGDFGWHQAFGIERDIAALLSPTHLLLMTGGTLMVTAPVRAAWSRPGPRALSWRDFWPLLGSLTLVVALLSFFLMYVSPFRAVVALQPTFTSSGFRYIVEAAEVRLIAGVLIANAVLLAAVLFTLRRWQPPFGVFTVMFGVVGIAMSGLDSFERLPLGLCALIGGLAADVLMQRLKPGPTHVRAARLVAALVPLALWLPYFIVFKVAYDLSWTIHLWLGTVFMAVMGGLGLSLLVFPPEVPQEPAPAS